MKKIFQILLLVFFIYNTTFSQEISYEKIATDEKIFSGMIDDKYQISIYLKVFEMAEDMRYVHSVKGWYYYEKVKKKIPLVGVYDGGLTLYVFKSKEKEDSVLSFNSIEGNFWEKFDRVKNMSGYEEKFVFDDIEGSKPNEWKTPSKSLKLQIYDTDIRIKEEVEYLKIKQKEETKYINLSELNIGFFDFELITSKKIGSNLKLLLRYECSPAGNVQGMCGAGIEIGYVTLNYDEGFNLIDLQQIQIESCYSNISYEEEPFKNPEILIFKVENGSTETTQKVTIDKEVIQIKVEKI